MANFRDKKQGPGAGPGKAAPPQISWYSILKKSKFCEGDEPRVMINDNPVGFRGNFVFHISSDEAVAAHKEYATVALALNQSEGMSTPQYPPLTDEKLEEIRDSIDSDRCYVDVKAGSNGSGWHTIRSGGFKDVEHTLTFRHRADIFIRPVSYGNQWPKIGYEFIIEIRPPVANPDVEVEEGKLTPIEYWREDMSTMLKVMNKNFLAHISKGAITAETLRMKSIGSVIDLDGNTHALPLPGIPTAEFIASIEYVKLKISHHMDKGVFDPQDAEHAIPEYSGHTLKTIPFSVMKSGEEAWTNMRDMIWPHMAKLKEMHDAEEAHKAVLHIGGIVDLNIPYMSVNTGDSKNPGDSNFSIKRFGIQLIMVEGTPDLQSREPDIVAQSSDPVAQSKTVNSSRQTLRY